jgi:hypothetical protein
LIGSDVTSGPAPGSTGVAATARGKTPSIPVAATPANPRSDTPNIGRRAKVPIGRFGALFHIKIFLIAIYSAVAEIGRLSARSSCPVWFPVVHFRLTVVAQS